MELDALFKYLLWLVFFGIILLGIYTLFKKLGVAP
jgi:hypothetical protein